MYWNYRLIQRDGFVELVEAYYENTDGKTYCKGDEGVLVGYTDALLTAADKEDMQKTLALMHNDVKTKVVLQESELPGKELLDKE